MTDSERILREVLERTESAGAELGRGGFAVARVDACDGRGRALDGFDGYDDALARRFMGRSLSAGELGCHESHMRALVAFLASGGLSGGLGSDRRHGET